MIELVATIVIMASSVLLFGYWFRYTCLLILSARTTRDYAARWRWRISSASWKCRRSCSVRSTDLDRLRDSLDRDYKVLTYLLKTRRECC